MPLALKYQKNDIGLVCIRVPVSLNGSQTAIVCVGKVQTAIMPISAVMRRGVILETSVSRAHQVLHNVEGSRCRSEPLMRPGRMSVAIIRAPTSA
jgi:hypothetical protein